MKFKIITILLLFILISCSIQKDAHVLIEKINKGKNTQGHYYEEVFLVNDGEQPAYFVILIGKAYKNGNELQRIEKGYGDIWPQESKSYTLTYNNLGFSEPDSITYQITYSQGNINPVK